MYSMKLYEHDHFDKEFEDFKNNLYIVVLNKKIDMWIDENVKHEWDIDCEDLYQDKSKDIEILFEDEDEYNRFRLTFKYHYQCYWPEMYAVELNNNKNFNDINKWLIKYIGSNPWFWRRYLYTYKFFKVEDAVLFKMKWYRND